MEQLHSSTQTSFLFGGYVTGVTIQISVQKCYSSSSLRWR